MCLTEENERERESWEGQMDYREGREEGESESEKELDR